MGGINSGRRPDLWEQRPQVEDALILDIALLHSYNALTSGISGVLQWPGNQGRVVFHTHGDTITFDYLIKGRPYCQTITFATIPLQWRNGTSRPCILCSACQRRGYKLYLSRKPYFLCRACQGLVYVSQSVHYGGWCYAYIQILKRIHKEERRFEAWRKRHNRSTVQHHSVTTSGQW